MTELKHLQSDEREMLAHNYSKMVRVFAKRLNEARARIAELEREQRWIPVTESLPVEIGDFLVCGRSQYGIVNFIDISTYLGAEGFDRDSMVVTHWRSVSPPSEATK